MYARPPDSTQTLNLLATSIEYQPLFDIAARDFDFLYPYVKPYTRASQDELSELWRAGRYASHRGGTTIAIVGLGEWRAGIDGGGEALSLYAGIGQAKRLYVFEKHLEWGARMATMLHPDWRTFILCEPHDYVLEDLKPDLALVVFNYGHATESAGIFVPYLAQEGQMIFCGPSAETRERVAGLAPAEQTWLVEDKLLMARW